MMGGVVVTLTDEFFDDPLGLRTNKQKYLVIPLRMTNVKNADKIRTGTAAEGVASPNLLDPDDWKELPKNYTLYAIKYMNPWDVIYLRRGTDAITENGVSLNITRPLVAEGQKKISPEEDEVIRLNSISINAIEFSVSNHRTENGQAVNPEGVKIDAFKGANLNMTFKLDFNGNNCTFANGAWKGGAVVQEYTGDGFKVTDIAVSGGGEYKIDGEKKSWNNKDRDALYLNYTVEYKIEAPAGSAPKTVKFQTTDVLVFRDRGVALETFEPVLKP